MHEHARRLVQLAMAEASVDYKQLAKLLKEDNPSSTHSPTSLPTLINRGTFQFAFALTVFRVLEIETVDLKRVLKLPVGKSNGRTSD